MGSHGAEATEAERASQGVGHALRETFSQSWDYVQLLMAGSFLWALSWLVAAVPLGLIGLSTPLVVPATFAAAALAVGPATMGLYGLAAQMRRRELPHLRDFLDGFVRWYVPGVLWFLINAFFLLLGLVAVWFYGTQFDHWLPRVLGVVCLYIVAFWLAAQLYVPAFLVREDSRVGLALKRAVFLTLAHPGYSAIVLVQVAALCALVIAPVLMGWGAVIGLSFVIFFFVLPCFAALAGTNAMEDLICAHLVAERGEEDQESEQGGSGD